MDEVRQTYTELRCGHECVIPAWESLDSWQRDMLELMWLIGIQRGMVYTAAALQEVARQCGDAG